MKRRSFLGMMGLGVAGFGGYRLWPDEGIWNPCLPALPEELKRHELVRAAFDGIDATRLWDTHVHLIGVGDSGSGIWVTPAMDSLANPLQYAQKRFYLNAGCASGERQVDTTYIERLMRLQDDFPAGTRFMLLAFDHHYSANGSRRDDLSSFYTPNEYALSLSKMFPERFATVASVHPYRANAIELLEMVAHEGAYAIKWLPPAMGMDPASPQCDHFYESLARLGLALLTHAGDERAVHGGDAQTFGNPLKLRRALDHGVTVIVAHCASLGDNVDLDKGPNGPRVSNFDLFSRLMDEQRYQGKLYGEISAMTQINRVGVPLDTILRRTDWHERLLNGSDYPLPAVMPLFSMTQMVELGYLRKSQADVISRIRRHNSLLFDFVLKRTIEHNGMRLSRPVFESRSLFDRLSRPRKAFRPRVRRQGGST